jgi:hypothetical protein
VSEKVWSRAAEVKGARHTPAPLPDHFPDVRLKPNHAATTNAAAAPRDSAADYGHAAGDDRYWSDDDDMSQKVGPAWIPSAQYAHQDRTFQANINLIVGPFYPKSTSNVAILPNKYTALAITSSRRHVTEGRAGYITLSMPCHQPQIAHLLHLSASAIYYSP